MSETFFERPILDSPCASPHRHSELDSGGQPANQIIETGHRSDLSMLTPRLIRGQSGNAPINLKASGHCLSPSAQQLTLRMGTWR